MGLRSIMRLLALTGAIAIVGAFATSALGVDSPPPPPNPDNPYEGDKVVKRQIARQLNDRKERDAKRKTDAAKAERKASRTRYKDKSDRDALAIARAKFENFLEAPTWTGLDLRPGEKVKKYLDDFQALLQNDDGQTAVVASELPLRTQAGEPTNLALRAQGDGFAPVAPTVELDLPGDLGDGIGLAGGQLRVKPVTDAETDATEAGDKAFYGNAQTDTDVLVKPTAQGFETFTQLRSADSPEQVAFDVEVPGGAALRQDDTRGPDPAGQPPIEVVSPGGKRIARISAPRAVAADGEPVDSSYSIDGMRVTMHVAHRDLDVAYPILVDPDYIYEDWRHWATGNRDQYGWQAGSWGHPSCGWAAYFGGGSWTYGRVVYHPNGNYCEVDNWAEWKFQAPRMSYIYRAEFHYMNHQNRYTCAVNGLWNAWGGNWDGGWAWVHCGDLWNHARGHCPANNDCNWDNGAPSNVAVFKVQIAYGNGNRSPGARAELGGSLIYLRDRDNPVVDSIGQQTDGRWYRANSGSAWVRPTAHDDGLGMNKFQLIAPNHADAYRRHPCVASRCPGSWSLPNDGQSELNFNIDALPEGINTLTVNARDVLDKITGGSFTVNVDRGIPNLNVYGALRDAEHEGLWWGSKTLQIDSSDGTNDGNPANHRSGVTAVDIYVDGVRKHQRTQSCFASCAMNFAWTFDASQYAPGNHTVRVVARDGAGNERSSSTWTVTTAHSDPATQQKTDEYETTGDAPAEAPGIDPNRCLDPTEYCGEADASNPAETAADAEPPLAGSGSTWTGPGLPKINVGSEGWGLAEQDWRNLDRRLIRKMFAKPVKHARVIIPWDMMLLKYGMPNTVPGYETDPRPNYKWLVRDPAVANGTASKRVGQRINLDSGPYDKYSAFMQKAKENGWRVMVSFGATEAGITYNGMPGYKLGPRVLPDPLTTSNTPTEMTYFYNVKRILTDLRTRFPEVKLDYISAWNEPNHPAYSTSGRFSFPHLRTVAQETPPNDVTTTAQMREAAPFAAKYFNLMRKWCTQVTPRCGVLAGEMVDRYDMPNYFNIYEPLLNARPKRWAYHPYVAGHLNVLHGEADGSDADTVPEARERFEWYMKRTADGSNPGPNSAGADMWFTEVGPMYSGDSGNPAWDKGVQALQWQIDLARHARVKRFYYYSTRGDYRLENGVNTGHDSGFIDPSREEARNPDGTLTYPDRADQIRDAYCLYGRHVQASFVFDREPGTTKSPADDPNERFVDGVRRCP